MRARPTALIVTAAALALAAHVPAGAAPAVPSGVAVGFSGPESAVWDAHTNAWYISNSGLAGGEAGVVRLEPGAQTPEPFVTGLDGPQGVTIEGSTMYVADGANVRVIDMDDPADMISIPIGGASDLDVDPDTGDVYVTDLGANAVRRIRDGVAEPFATIESPDGLYFADGAVFVANFGLDGTGGVYRIDVETAEITPVSEMPFATLDGLERDGDGWLATDFLRGHILAIDSGGASEIIGQLLPGSADLGLDPQTRTIAVPNLVANVVVFLTV